MVHIDWEKLRLVIKEETLAIRELKKQFRASGYQRTASDDRLLRSRKRLATIHHAIAAHARGHIHLTTWSDELSWHMKIKRFLGEPMSQLDQAKLISEEQEKFTIPYPDPDVEDGTVPAKLEELLNS